MIQVTYTSIDRFRASRRFKTLTGAQKFAQRYVGSTPEMGSSYAVSGDGVGKITASGVGLAELFPATQPVAIDDRDTGWTRWNAECRAEDDAAIAAERARLDYRPYRSLICTCTDAQLTHVGCNCGDLPF